jgi:hypothetical protein
MAERNGRKYHMDAKSMVSGQALGAGLAGGAPNKPTFVQQRPPQPTADDFEVLKNQLLITEQQRNQLNSAYTAQQAQLMNLSRKYNELEKQLRSMPQPAETSPEPESATEAG